MAPREEWRARLVAVPPSVAVPSRLRDAAGVDVEVVADPGAVASVAGAVDCVVCAAADLPDPVAVVEAARRHPAGPPVVAVAPDDPALEGRLLDAGAAEVLRQSVADEATVARRIERVATRAQRRAHLDAERRKLDVILEDLPVFLFFKDEEARYVRTGGLLEEGYGELVGKREVDVDWTVGDDQEEIYRDDRHVVETGEPVVRKEYDRVAHVAFDWGGVSETKVPWREGGELRGLVGVAYDIPEQKRRQRQLRHQNERLEEFVSAVSHDLRSPLAVARGTVGAIRDGDADDGELDRLERSLDRMDELIGDLLVLARHGQFVTDTEPVNLGRVAGRAWRALDAADASVDIAVRAHRELEADPDRLRQLLANLLANAVEHAGEDVHVEVGVLDDGFFVADDGPGIPPGERDAVFERGYTTSEEGTGFGLAVVDTIARVHEWEVTVTGSEAGGARFEVRGANWLRDSPGGEAEDVESAAALPVGEEVDGNGETFVVHGAGRNVWGFKSEFHFVHAPAEGDLEVTARVAGVAAPDEWSKAALMVRDRLSEFASQAFVGLTRDHGSEFGASAYPADATRTEQVDDGAEPPYWYRIRRSGETVVGLASPDGERWREVGRDRIDLGAEVHAGLAVCAAADGQVATAAFDGVEGLDGWSSRDVGDVDLDGDVEVYE